MESFSNRYITEKSVDEVLEILTSDLETEGFKVIQSLDTGKILNEKVDPNFETYKVIGVCNPKLSHELLSQDKSIGLFLPCKIALYSENEKTKILVQRPTWISSFFYSKHIESVTRKVEDLVDKSIKNSL